MLAHDSEKLLHVRARFGLPVRESPRTAPDRHACLRQAGERLADELGPGGVGLITGPSGSGKSLTLCAFALAANAQTVTHVSSAAKRPPVSMIRGDLDRVLAILAATGLGEARRLVTPAGLLSEGERARLALARTIARARGRTIACDEFTSTLDRLTSRSVCRCVRRALTPAQRLVCATAHDDVASHLDPDIVVYVPLSGPPEFVRREDEHADDASSSVV